VHRGDELVRSPEQLSRGDKLDVRVAEGTFGAIVD
jgi:hypothetical protein